MREPSKHPIIWVIPLNIYILEVKVTRSKLTLKESEPRFQILSYLNLDCYVPNYHPEAKINPF